MKSKELNHGIHGMHGNDMEFRSIVVVEMSFDSGGLWV